MYSMNSRAYMREFWRYNPLGDKWTIQGNPKLMGQTILASPTLKLRVLKENARIHPGGVPVAGGNAARDRDWTQLPFATQPPLPGISPGTDPRHNLTGRFEEPASATCLLLFDVRWDDPDFPVAVRVVHTLAPGKFGRQVPIDFSFEVRSSGEMYELLRFDGSSEYEDLYYPNIDPKENDGDDGSKW